MNRIKTIYMLRGMDAAMAELKQMAEFFSGCCDWADIYNGVINFLLEMKQQSEQTEADLVTQRDAALISAIAKNGLSGQINLMLGSKPQAPYYGASTNEGDKH